MRIITKVKRMVSGLPPITKEMMEKAGYKKLDIDNSSEDNYILLRCVFILHGSDLKDGQKVKTIILPKDGELKSDIVGFSIEHLGNTKEFKICYYSAGSMSEKIVDPYGIDNSMEIKEAIEAMRNEENISITRISMQTNDNIYLDSVTKIGVRVNDDIYFGLIEDNKIIFETEVKKEDKIIIERMSGLIINLFVGDKRVILEG